LSAFDPIVMHDPRLWLLIATLGVAAAVVAYRVGRQRRRASQFSEAGWIQSLDFADDAIYLVDLDDNLVRGNQAFYRYIDRTPAEADGRNLEELVHGGREDPPCPVCEARRERRDAVFVKEADDPANRLGRPIEISVRVVRDARGEPIGMLQLLRDLSRQRRAEEALRESEERYRRLSEAAFEGIMIHDDGVLVDANRTLARMIGYTVDELYGRDILQFVADESRPRAVQRLKDRLEEPYELVAVRKDGSRFDADVRGRNFLWEGRTLRVVAVRDISELKRTRDALFQEKERLSVTLESIGEGVITTDVHGFVQYLNPVAAGLTGWVPEQARGRALSEIFHILDETTGEFAADPVRRCLLEDRVVKSTADSTLRGRDGREFAIEHASAPIRGRDGTVVGVVLTFRDVTEMRHMARQLSYQASHDGLTGLLNRHEFENLLHHALGTAVSDDRQHALCYLDLDQFKVVNDTCGHGAGDQLLIQLAALLRARLRSSDFLARLGGDEFGVLLDGCPLSKAVSIAEDLRGLVADFRFVWQDRGFDVGVSIGVVPITAATGSVAEALSTADAACYVAKEKGRNRVHVYQPDDLALAKHHGDMEWAQRVARAVEEGRLSLYCQPIVALRDRERAASHYEILVRMEDGGRTVLPSTFIPAAERYNVMAAVDRWVLRAGLQALAALARTGVAPMFSINISGRSLDDDGFLEFAAREIERAEMPAGRLCIEITETAAIANFAQAQRFVSMLRERGCRFALDDFGSGLSSFSYLKNLSVDYLKIDSSFVRDVATDPIDYAMVDSINQLGHVMGIETVAEFAENEAILDKLTQLGVDYAQGYAIAPPRPLSEVFGDLIVVAAGSEGGTRNAQ